MPWNGSAPSKTFGRTDGTRTGSTTWQQADAASVDIVAPDHDTHDQDMADGINSCLMKDGGNTATSNIPMGGFTFTNLAAATARTQPARFSDLQDGKGIYVPTVGGTGNAITLTTGYTVTAYAAGQRFSFIVGTTNTGAATVNVDSLGSKSIVRSDGSNTALAAGDLVAGAIADIEYDGTRFHLMSTQSSTATGGDVLARIVKTGTILAWPHATVPSGWLECDGSAISRTTYAELFAAISTTYGVGDGSTTFNIPDLRGRFLRGYDSTATVDVDAASRTDRGDGTTGNSVGTKQADATEAHVHTQTGQQPTFTYTPNTANMTGVGTSFVSALAASGLGSSIETTADASPGDTASTGGSETRPVNTTVKWIILALPAAASASSLGVNGFLYNWDTGTTDADPGSGKLRVNNATLSSATKLYINETGANSESLASILATWDDSTSTIKGNLFVYKVGAPGTYAYFQVTGSITDAGSYDKFDLTYVANNGTLANGDNVTVLFIRNGDKGTTGDAGTDGGIKFTYDSSTSMADPGTGDIRFNNATLSSVTAAAVSDLCAESGNPDVSAYVLAWDDSTNTSLRGTLLIREDGSPQNFVLFDVTGASTDNSGWTQLVLTYVAHSGSFSNGDTLLITFSRSGNLGATGATGSTGTDAGVRWNFDSSTTMADPGAGDIRLNNATLASVTAIAVSDNCAESGNPDVSTFVLAWDDSTTTALRGTLIIKKTTAPQNFAIYSITGGSTDNVGWTELAVTHVQSSGSFSNADALSIAFTRTGNAGAGSGDLLAANNLSDVANAGTSRTNLGVGTGDSPQFAAVNIGHASDTTITRTGAGDIAVEGNAIYRAGGTDVPITDGGTGQSTSTAAFDALSPVTTRGDIIVRNASNNARLAVGSAGTVLKSDGTDPAWAKINAANIATTIPPLGISEPVNLGLAASVASNALTIAVKGADGNDASSTNPVLVPFRNVTIATGTPTWQSLTAALSLTISSGSTLGVTSNIAFRIWIVLFDDGGTLRLGAINCRTTTQIYPLLQGQVKSSTAEGGAGAADSAGVFYTGSAVSSKAYRILGYMEWESGLATAGTWASGPTRIVLFGPGTPLPGQVIQSARATTNSAASNNTTSYVDTNLSLTMTVENACNPVFVDADGAAAVDTNAIFGYWAITRGGTVLEYSRPGYITTGAIFIAPVRITAMDFPGAAGSTTWKVRQKVSNAAATASFGLDGGGGDGGAAMSAMEIMG